MAYLTKHFMDRLLEAGVSVDYMNRECIAFANVALGIDEVRSFCGYYWTVVRQGNLVLDHGVTGPFRTASAAYASAYKQLGLGIWKPKK